MSIRLTSEQETLVHSAVEDGMAPSAEQFVTEALERRRDDLAFDRWVRDVVAPASERFAGDPSTGTAPEDVLPMIKARREGDRG